MIYATHDVRVELGRVWYIPPLRLWNNGIHHSIVFHCFAHGFPLTVEPTKNLCLHWKSINENTGFYSTIDGETAYSVSGNKITFQLSPELLENEYPVFVHVGVLDNDGKCCGTLTQEVALYVKQVGIKLDPKMVAPYINGRYKEATDTGSTIAVTLSNIAPELITRFYLEYALRPLDAWLEEHEPISIPIEIGDFAGGIPGKIYEIALPVSAGFAFRTVLEYVDYDGNNHTLCDCDDGWNITVPCADCGGIHSWERLNYPHNNPTVYTYINPNVQGSDEETKVQVRATQVNGTVTDWCLEYAPLPVEDKYKTYNVDTIYVGFGTITEERREYIHTDEDGIFSVPIEVGNHDYLDGHSEYVTIPVSSGYACRTVLHYTQNNGFERVKVSEWNTIDRG